ncbi:MAG: PKD domain-containing protein [Thermoplasmata archaeon]
MPPPGGAPQGNGIDTSSEAERERFRKKLAQWKEMGFDVSELEVLLETDIERFRERRLELLKQQLHPPARPPVEKPPQAQPPPSLSPPEPGVRIEWPAPTPPPPQPMRPARPRASSTAPGETPTALPHAEIRYPTPRRRRPGAMAPARGVPELAKPGEKRGIIRLEEKDRGGEGGPGPVSSGEQVAQERRYAREAERTERATPGSSPEALVVRKVRKVRKVRRVAPHPPQKVRRGAILAALAIVLILLFAALLNTFTHPAEVIKARITHPPSASAGEVVVFDGSGSSSSTGKLVWYKWSFGDGTTEAGKKKTVSHFYSQPGSYVVELVVRNEAGRESQPARSRINVRPLSVVVPEKRVDDRAYYDVSGAASLSNNDTYLYTIQLPSGSVHVNAVSFEFSGTLDQWVWEVTTREDGFKVQHRALHVYSKETLRLDGNASTTTAGTYRLGGNLSYDENTFSDPASGGVFLVEARARTTISLLLISFPGSTLDSTDTLRAYSKVGDILDQFQLEKIYRGKSFSQETPSSLNGSLSTGGGVYYWSPIDARDVRGRPSLGLHITMDADSMRRFGLNEFFIDMWLCSNASLPTRIHTHLSGRSGETFYSSDHISEMRGFSAGTFDVDTTPQSFNPSPLPQEFFASFNDVPQMGSGASSLRFSPSEAVQEAKSRSQDFSQFLSSHPQAYAVCGTYTEGSLGPQSASWNLTFAWPGAAVGYFINVTRTLAGEYILKSDWISPPTALSTAEASIPRTLTMASAEALMRSDNETARRFFKEGGIDFPSVSLSLRADHLHPSLSLVSMYAAAEKTGYAVLLESEGCVSAFSMETGQMLYFYTHSSGK